MIIRAALSFCNKAMVIKVLNYTISVKKLQSEFRKKDKKVVLEIKMGDVRETIGISRKQIKSIAAVKS